MTALAACAGLAADRLLGEPPTRWHPVVWFGSTMNAVESQLYADARIRGAAYSVVGMAVAATPALAIRRIVGETAATTVASAVAIAGAMLERQALGVAESLLAEDLDAARRSAGVLVGRSTGELDAAEVSRAVVETVAENTVDAVTATLFWASVGGAPAALVHRAINTMDAMVGHRSARHARFGSVSARCDDVANWLPARLTALAVAASSPMQARAVVRTVRRDARRHPDFA